MKLCLWDRVWSGIVLRVAAAAVAWLLLHLIGVID